MMNYIIRTKKYPSKKIQTKANDELYHSDEEEYQLEKIQTKANDDLYHSDGENINQGKFSRKRMNHIIRTEKRNISIEEDSIETNDDNISLAQKYIKISNEKRTTGRIIYTYYWRLDGKYIKQNGTNEQGLGRNDQTLGKSGSQPARSTQRDWNPRMAIMLGES